MKLLHDVIAIWQRLTRGARRRRLDREIEDELRFHLDMRAEDASRDGAPDGRLAARRRFGNVAAIRDEVRDTWTFPSFESFWQDVRYAFRMLRRTPGFTLVAILVLAIGIGANTAIFSLVDAVLVRGLPYPHADRLVLLIGNVQRATVERRGTSYPDYLDWRAQATAFSDMAAWDSVTVTLGGEGEPERLNAELVSASYFGVLAEAPALGRAFGPDEDQVPVRNPAVVLSDGLWRRRYGADPAVVGRTIQLNGASVRVLGVMPEGFTGLSDQADLWLPFALNGGLDRRDTRGFYAVARLKDDVTARQAQQDMDAVSRRLETEYPDTNDKRGAEVIGLGAFTFSGLRPAVLALMVAVVLVLLIACANVANLLIGRSETRQREMAMRAALGAGRGRLVRQLVTESLVLAVLGAAGGLAVAVAAIRTLVATIPVTLPTFMHPGLDPLVLLYATGLAAATGVLLGLAPATHARASVAGSVLKDATRGSTGLRSGRLRGVLVVAEVSLAVVLLVGAGLLVRSVQKLAAIDPGFDPDSVLTLNVSIPAAPARSTPPGGPPAPELAVSPHLLLERVGALPGVTSASLTSDVPLGGSAAAIFYAAEGGTTTDAETRPRAYYHRVSPSFFETLRIPILSGRTFLDSEATPDNTAVIVSEGVARRFWPGQDAVGHRIKAGSASSSNPWMTIVGVVGDTKYRGLPRNPTNDPDLFLPALERGSQALMVRTGLPPDSVAPSVRAAIREVGPSVVIYNVDTLDRLVERQSARSRFITWLMGIFAAAALLLSVVGIYGVMSYLVTQRRREFGIRLALGATRRQIVRLVLGDGARLVGVGIVIGTGAAFGLARLLASLLFGVTAIDVASAVAVVVLGAVALVACYLPAVRATQVDPSIALRDG